MTRKQRIVAAVAVVLTFYFFLLPGFWAWLPPKATTEIPVSWPHNQDMPLKIRLSAWHSNYEVREVRFGILPDRNRVQPNSPPLYPLVLLEGQHNRTWNRLTLNRFTFPATQRISVVVPSNVWRPRGGSCRVRGQVFAFVSIMWGVLTGTAARLGRTKSVRVAASVKISVSSWSEVSDVRS